MLFSKLKISTKIIISSAVFLIPIGIMLFFIWSNAVGTIQKSNKGMNAIDPLKSAVKVMRDLPLYLDIYLDLVEGRGLKELIEYIDEPDEQIKELYGQSSELYDQIDRLYGQIDELYDQIDRLYGQIDELDDRIDEPNNQRNELDDQIDGLYAKRSELYDQIRELYYLNRDLLISRLDNQINDELRIMYSYLEPDMMEGKELPNLPEKWEVLKKIDRTDENLIQEYEGFANLLKDMIERIGVWSGLTLVSDINTYYFVSAFSDIPEAVTHNITAGNIVRKYIHNPESFIKKYNKEMAFNEFWWGGANEWLKEVVMELFSEQWEEQLGGQWEELWDEWWEVNEYEWWDVQGNEWWEVQGNDLYLEQREKRFEEWWEEHQEEWLEENAFVGDQWNVDLQVIRDFDDKEFFKIFTILNFFDADEIRINASLGSVMGKEDRDADILVEAEEDQINASLESAMEEGDGEADNFEKLINRLRRYWETFPGSAMGEESREADDFEELKNKLKWYGETAGTFRDFYFFDDYYYWPHEYINGVAFLEDLSPLYTALCELWYEVFTNIGTQVELNSAAAMRNLILYIGIVLVSLFIAFSFLIFITLDISRSVKSLKTLFKGLNENDLTMSMKVNSKDEFGELMTAFNGFLIILRSTVGSFKQSSQLVANSVFDLASSTKEITTTANEQSAGVSEIVSTMESSKNLSEQIAIKTNEVANLANETQDLSSKGAELREANQAMMEDIRNQNQKIISEIRNVSDMIIRISEAIRIIDGIADQTKLIAFNASLEASSSGEAGARFSVVASEIRRFADNVVESTREIKQKIEEVQGASQSLIAEANSGSRQIETGYERMSEQKIVFEQIVDVSQNVATRSQQISNLSKQQELASSQIFTALKEISAGVKQFVAATSSTSKIADSLNGMSEELKEKVEKYRTET